MRNRVFGAALAAIAAFGIAQVVGAQGLPPMREGFEHRGPGGPGGGRGGPGGPGGLMGGQRGCVATSTTPCPAYQFTFTITSTEPVLVGGSASTITNTTTGTIAGDTNGSTYRDVKLSGMRPFASQGGPEELIFIKNLDPSVMMDYIVNVTKNTYEQFAIHPHTPHTPPANGQGKRPNGSANRPAPTVVMNYKISDGSYTCPTAEQTSFSHTVQLPGESSTSTITTNRVYCTNLKLVVEEDHSDPRFGTRTYQLSGYMATPHVSFTPPSGATLVQPKFQHGGPGGKHQPPPNATPQS